MIINPYIFGAGAPPPPPAPVLLCGFNGADGATSFTSEDAFARVATFGGNAQLDTAEKMFGASSLLCDGTNDWITFPASTDFTFGFDDFTIEGFIRRTGGTTRGVIGRGATANTARWQVHLEASALLSFYSGTGGSPIVSSGSTGIAVNTWYHFAVTRTAGTTRLFIAGVMCGKVTTSYNITDAAEALIIGSDSAVLSARSWLGWIDEVRVFNGYSVYQSDTSFTPPSSEFPR